MIVVIVEFRPSIALELKLDLKSGGSSNCDNNRRRSY